MAKLLKLFCALRGQATRDSPDERSAGLPIFTRLSLTKVHEKSLDITVNLLQ